MEKLDNPQRRKMMPPEETLLKFNIQDDGTFLDIGCGIGYFTIAASNIIKANKIIGIDIMPDMLEVAVSSNHYGLKIKNKNNQGYI